MTALLQPDADPEAAALARAIQPALDELLREVRRSTNYYQSQLADTGQLHPACRASRRRPAARSPGSSSPAAAPRCAGWKSTWRARLGVPVEDLEPV